MLIYGLLVFPQQMLIQPIESSSTQMFFHMLHFFLDHKDRYHITNGRLSKEMVMIFQEIKHNDLMFTFL